jgi:hypothetical protein
MAAATSASGKQLRGLACMTPERRREIARKGQKAAREAGKCYKFDHQTAVRAGHLAGSLKRYPYVRPGTGMPPLVDLRDIGWVKEALRTQQNAQIREAIAAESDDLSAFELKVQEVELAEAQAHVAAETAARPRETGLEPSSFETPAAKYARELAATNASLRAQLAVSRAASAAAPAARVEEAPRLPPPDIENLAMGFYVASQMPKR